MQKENIKKDTEQRNELQKYKMDIEKQVLPLSMKKKVLEAEVYQLQIVESDKKSDVQCLQEVYEEKLNEYKDIVSKTENPNKYKTKNDLLAAK